MTRAALLWVLATIGCGSASSVVPRIAAPEPCVCPAKSTNCESEVAAGSVPAPPLDVESPAYRARAVALVAQSVDHWLLQEGLSQEASTQLQQLEPSAVANLVAVAAQGPEQDILRAMHELRELGARDDDATPPAERKVLLWQRFAAEVESFREAAADAIALRLVDVIMERAAVAITVGRVAKWVNRDFAPMEEQRLAFARERARLLLREYLLPAAREKSDAIAAKRKGQWLAVLHGKN